MNKSSLEVIFFDLGSVLIRVNKAQALERLASVTKTPLSEIQRDFETKQPLFESFNKGLLDRQSFFKQINHGYDLSFETFYDIYTSIFSLDNSVYEIARQLSAQFRLSIISNTDELHFKRIQHDYPELQMFESPITSFEAHALKPEDRIYFYALHHLHTRAERALLIDDIQENIQAARSIGMHGIHFTSAAQLEHDLNQLELR